MTDLYTEQHAGLVMIHRMLADAFAPLIGGATTPLSVLIPHARQAGGFLLGHHDMESRVLFAGLRTHGQLRSTDCAFLDARDRDHHDIHQLCEALLATCGALHPHSATIVSQARELVALLEPHTREEEIGLAPERLREMIDPAGLAALLRDIDAARLDAQARHAAV